jgi:hypothetical protein
VGKLGMVSWQEARLGNTSITTKYFHLGNLNETLCKMLQSTMLFDE